VLSVYLATPSNSLHADGVADDAISEGNSRRENSLGSITYLNNEGKSQEAKSRLQRFPTLDGLMLTDGFSSESAKAVVFIQAFKCEFF
jgi:hypothetical protein